MWIDLKMEWALGVGFFDASSQKKDASDASDDSPALIHVCACIRTKSLSLCSRALQGVLWIETPVDAFVFLLLLSGLRFVFWLCVIPFSGMENWQRPVDNE